MTTIQNIINFLHAENDLILFTNNAYSEIITRAVPITESKSGDISFCGYTAREPKRALLESKASLLLIDRNISFDKDAIAKSGINAIIMCDNARLSFIHVVTQFFSPPPLKAEIHPTAVISSSAIIASDVHIGAYSTIGENVSIGSGCVIHSNVHIYNGVQILKNVTIHSGVIIGADGFGYQRDTSNKLIKFPQIGNVIIENDVEIGANTCIDRATLGSTHVCEGVKIDNFVHIAHNVYIGKHTAVTAHVMFAGGVKIGEYSWIAPSSSFRDRLTVGNKVTIGIGSVVVKNVPHNITVLGVPAREYSKKNNEKQLQYKDI